jgi:hypothetical protein
VSKIEQHVAGKAGSLPTESGSKPDFRTQYAEKTLQRVFESLSFSNPAAAGLIRTWIDIVWLR